MTTVKTTFANNINCFTGEYVGPGDPPPATLLKSRWKSRYMHRRKLAEDQLLELRILYATGEKRKALAYKYNLSVWTVDDILHYRGAYSSDVRLHR